MFDDKLFWKPTMKLGRCPALVTYSDQNLAKKTWSNPCSSLASKKIRLGFLDIALSFLFFKQNLTLKFYLQALTFQPEFFFTLHFCSLSLTLTKPVCSECFQTLMWRKCGIVVDYSFHFHVCKLWIIFWYNQVKRKLTFQKTFLSKLAFEKTEVFSHSAEELP